MFLLVLGITLVAIPDNIMVSTDKTTVTLLILGYVSVVGGSLLFSRLRPALVAVPVFAMLLNQPPLIAMIQVAVGGLIWLLAHLASR